MTAKIKRGDDKIIDLSFLENDGFFVEGTGSLVFDHDARIAYAGRSVRTTEAGVRKVCEVIGYKPVFFEAELDGKPVYHTNVVLALGPGWAVWFGEGARMGREAVEKSLGDRQILQLTASQVREYAGNLLVLRGKAGAVTVLSRRAWQAFLPEQRQKLGRTLVVDIPVIETVGGGSARCMMAERW